MATLSAKSRKEWASRWLTDELSALAKKGSWEAAIGTFAQLHGSNIVKANEYHYTTVITGCGRGGNWEAAFQTFSHMLQSDVKPNVYTYTTLINIAAQQSNSALALKTYAHMDVKNEVVPNARTLAAVIGACARGGKWQKALAALDSAPAKMIAPNVFMYTSAMDGCRRAGKWEAAISLLDEMKASHDEEVKPNAVTYNTAIQACCDAGAWNPALNVLAAMLADGYEPVQFTKTNLEKCFEDVPELAGKAELLHVKARRHPGQQGDAALDQ